MSGLPDYRWAEGKVERLLDLATQHVGTGLFRPLSAARPRMSTGSSRAPSAKPADLPVEHGTKFEPALRRFCCDRKTFPHRRPSSPSTMANESGTLGGAVAQTAAPSSMPDLRGIRVLVVDDDPDAREIFAASLIHAGAEVQTAASARQALTILKARVPDVAVTDMSMPGEDGLWLLNQIKRHSPEAARVPVVVVTGHRHLYRDRDMLSVGFHRYMTKPVDPWQLCGTVRELAHDAHRG